MTLLMTETDVSTLDGAAENRKRRRLEGAEAVDGAITPLMINPVSQQLNRINMVVPDFNCASVLNNEISRIQLSSLFLQYKAVVLFFYECDFTPSACKDITLINDNFERFQSCNTIPLAMSTDTEMVHTAFMSQSILGFVPLFPLVADTTRSVSRHFNVVNPETGLARRAAFIIDNTRQVRFSFVIEDNRISHSMDTICTILQTF